MAQMVVLQCSFYLIVGLSIALCSVLFGTDLTLSDLLDAHHLDALTPGSWPSIVAFLIVAPALGYLLSAVVGRAKKCLDFCFTVYFWHFVICCCYGSFPWNWEWWAVNILALIVSVLLGEFLCWKKEMQDIPRHDRDPATTELVKKKDSNVVSAR